MIKVIVLIRRNPKLTREEFSRHWRTTHAPLVESLPMVSRYIRKYVQNHIAPDAARDESTVASALGDLPPGDSLQIDGIAEIWYDSVEDAQRSVASQEYMDLVRPDEMTMSDLSQCIVIMADEFVVFDEANRPKAEQGSTD